MILVLSMLVKSVAERLRRHATACLTFSTSAVPCTVGARGEEGREFQIRPIPTKIDPRKKTDLASLGDELPPKANVVRLGREPPLDTSTLDGEWDLDAVFGSRCDLVGAGV